MPTRDTLLIELHNLAADIGPDITLFKFHEATGIHPCHIYRKWGNWTTLRLAAGLPPRSRIPKVYSDDHLFQELNRTGATCSEFPTISAFGRFSQRCWATLSNRFGRRSEVWRRYFSWLQQHEPAQRPAYAQDLPPDVDPATVPGVTSHRSAEARQQAIDDYNEQRLYLHESLLGPPPPGWKPGPPKLNEANWNFDVGPGAPSRLRRAPKISPTSASPTAAESDIHDKPDSESAATAPGGSAPVPVPPAAAERGIHDKPISEPAQAGPAVFDDDEQLTPEEWNAFYNHPKAFPIVDINAGLFPRSPYDGRDPADPRPNPPPWERNFEIPPDPDSEPSPPHATEVPPASTLPPIAAEYGIHDKPISESAQTAPGGRGRKPVTLDEWDLYFKGLWVLMIATTVALAELSRPVRLAWEAGIVSTDASVFDYGCGRGGDLTLLAGLGVTSAGWDPVHRPSGERAPADVVNLGYVVNVIEDPAERAEALRGAWGLARRVLVVSARLDVEAKGRDLREFGDGVLTRRETFQKFYTQHELREWINATLGVDSVAAAPGVFFVFRDEDLRQTFAAARYRRTTAAPAPRLSDTLYQEHRAVLAPVEEFFATRGRLPDGAELDPTELERIFGSIRRAWGLVERVTGAEQWGRIRDERAQDLLVYLALAQFSKRPRMAALPAALQLDVKAFFGTYGEACRQADELLFSAGKAEAVSAACAKAACGKLTHEALYVHTAGLETLPPILRVFEGCARNYVGVVDDANLVKLHRFKPKVSYLAYPEFDGDPHPALVGALVVPLDSFDVKYWNYADSPNPPILHRKEEFVPAEYPGREKFARLTKQEERAGLFEETLRIGRREEWRHTLENKGVLLTGHRLIRNPGSATGN